MDTILTKVGYSDVINWADQELVNNKPGRESLGIQPDIGHLLSLP
jgi:hypothetical protein